MNKTTHILLVFMMAFTSFSGVYSEDTINSINIIDITNNTNTTIITTPQNNSVIYVSLSGNDGNDGLQQVTSKRTIQNAINTIKENGTIYISPGTYHEHLKINKNISLISTKESVVLDGDYKDTCMIIEENCSVSLEKLTIEKGMNTGLINHGQARLTKVTIQKNTAENNGGIHNTGNMTINHSKITENTAKGDNGGICNSGILTITKSEIKNNHASKNYGGISSNGTLTIKDSKINDNNGCGVELSCDNLVIISGSEFKGNKGAGVINDGVTLNITNSQFKKNKHSGVANSAGVLYLDNSIMDSNDRGVYNVGTATITKSKISKNDDNGINNDRYGNMDVINCSIVLNKAWNGGGIYNNARMNVVNCSIEGNSANEAGGGVFNGNTFWISNSSICGNHVTESIPRNLWRRFANQFSSEHGLDLNLKDGGGIHSYGYNPDTLCINNCTIVDNRAIRYGGGICCELGGVVINNSVIRQNKALNGGGIYLEWSNLSLAFTEVKYNFAVKGGGIYITGAPARLAFTEVKYNFAVKGNVESMAKKL